MGQQHFLPWRIDHLSFFFSRTDTDPVLAASSPHLGLPLSRSPLTVSWAKVVHVSLVQLGLDSEESEPTLLLVSFLKSSPNVKFNVMLLFIGCIYDICYTLIKSHCKQKKY